MMTMMSEKSRLQRPLVFSRNWQTWQGTKFETKTTTRPGPLGQMLPIAMQGLVGLGGPTPDKTNAKKDYKSPLGFAEPHFIPACSSSPGC